MGPNAFKAPRREVLYEHAESERYTKLEEHNEGGVHVFVLVSGGGATGFKKRYKPWKDLRALKGGLLTL